MSIKLLRIPVFVLFAAGSFLLSDGCWLKTKAVIAQLLLRHAWEETLRTGDHTKPWPWADTWPVARLQVDGMGIDQIVLEGESGEVLAFGPGHLPNSNLTQTKGNCILAGHRDTSFHFLRDLQQGDLLTLQVMDGTIHRFTIREMLIEKAENLYFYDTDNPTLTLITCYPFDALLPGGNLRYVVFGDGATDS